MNQKEVFLKALEEDRYDTQTRLIFADWLEEQYLDDEALEQRRMATSEWVKADKWMHALAKKAGQTCIGDYGNDEVWRDITYEDLIRAGHKYFLRESTYDRHFVQIGQETLVNIMNRNLLKKYWNNWEIITGIKINQDIKTQSPFSCSC